MEKLVDAPFSHNMLFAFMYLVYCVVVNTFPAVFTSGTPVASIFFWGVCFIYTAHLWWPFVYYILRRTGRVRSKPLFPLSIEIDALLGYLRLMLLLKVGFEIGEALQGIPYFDPPRSLSASYMPFDSALGSFLCF